MVLFVFILFPEERVEGFFFAFPPFFSPSIFSLCTSTSLITFSCPIIHLQSGVWGVAFWCSLVSYPVTASLGLSASSIQAPKNSILFLCYSTSCVPSKKTKNRWVIGVTVLLLWLLYSLLILLIPFSWAVRALPNPCFLVGINPSPTRLATLLPQTWSRVRLLTIYYQLDGSVVFPVIVKSRELL